MPTICPNCLRPVRSDAKFCGFCGTSFPSAMVVESGTSTPIPQNDAPAQTKPTSQERPKRTRKQVRRAVLISLIILLCLVLVAAFAVHYWPIPVP
jgi:hypothetical protein